MLEFTGVTAATRMSLRWRKFSHPYRQRLGASFGRRRPDCRRDEFGIARDHARQGWHGGFPAAPQAGGYSDLRSDEVADVTGAGDTVIATLPLPWLRTQAPKKPPPGNYAGGIVVMKRGTATVSQQELLEALEKTPPVAREH